MSVNYEKLGSEIRKLRQQKEMSQLDLASSSDVSIDTIRILENAVRAEIKLNTLVKISDTLEISLADLFASING